MNCPSCQATNSAENRFCSHCGSTLVRVCSSCERQNPADHNFCADCGQRLGSGAEPTIPGEGGAAERKQITLMFCDLMDSTELSRKVDPEDLHEILRAYQTSCANIVEGLDGRIAQYLGDGILVYFGHPRAHEDDPERAVTAGLAILNALPELNEGLQQRFALLRNRPLQVRVAIHTGDVVIDDVGGGSGQQRLALGDATNIAARLESVAEAGTVVVSDATYRRVARLFHCDDLGELKLRGVDEPVRAHRVLRRTSARRNAGEDSEQTPLVGREQEIALLLDRWEQVKQGRGQTALLCGEAGMGKSRLLRVFREQIAAEPHIWIQCDCSPHHRHSALFPVVESVLRGLFIDRDAPTERRIARLEDAFRTTGLPLDETIPLLAQLLSIPIPERYPELSLTPDEQRQRTLEILVTWLSVMARDQPVILAVEDLHWIDPSTLELLGLILDQVPADRWLVLATFRPDFEPPWSGRSHVVQLNLHPLTHSQMIEMAQSVAGRRLPSEVEAEVCQRADGVPLFVEELMKNLLESKLLVPHGDAYELPGPLPALAIPSTLQDSLMARLDRLGGAKEIAQLASAIGRDFSHELLAAIAPHEDRILNANLQRLVDAELLYRRGMPPQAFYSFKHTLIQDTAYSSLLRGRRKDIHKEIARVFRERFPRVLETEPEVVARHHAKAGELEAAIVLYRTAGEKATRRSAQAEAIDHLRNGIRLAKQLPDARTRSQCELELLVALGAPLIESTGQGSHEVAETYARARDLCREIGDAPELFPTLWGLARHYQMLGEVDVVLELNEQLLEHAKSSDDGTRLLLARLSLGLTCFWTGNFARSVHHLDRTLELYDAATHASLAAEYGQDAEVSALAVSATALWLLGRPDQARDRAEQAVRCGRDCGHPLSHAFALFFASVIHRVRAEPSRVEALASRGLELAEEKGLPVWVDLSRMMLGWARCQHDAHAIEMIQNALEALSVLGTGVSSQFQLTVMGDALTLNGRHQEALACLADALGVSSQSTFWSAETQRLYGEALLAAQPDSETDAECCFRDALEFARDQEALSLELRAASSLARLLSRRGEKAEARTLLTSVYERFDEGKDTADLLAAKDLLAELA